MIFSKRSITSPDRFRLSCCSSARNWELIAMPAAVTLLRVRTPSGASITASNNSNSGWLVGAGIEWAFLPNWSAKVEYNFLGLDDRTFIAPFGFQRLAGDTFFVRNRDIQMVKVGINYRFDWGGSGSGYGYGSGPGYGYR